MPYTDVRVLLARNMKRYRELYKLSQMALAERVGCSPTMIGNIEILKRFPSPRNINLIAEALEIPPSELFVEESSAYETIRDDYEVRERLTAEFQRLMDKTLSSRRR
ncbi:MAG: helix-turn-helix transcriptional regulator [Spirochaetes bacterium]|nr:helix-turn-helix transcriptional regulator [Spirochaetota bacterium]MBU1079827.1 helix-turn-helix transcriptional regulator [Spirochaetota bacterium]